MNNKLINKGQIIAISILIIVIDQISKMVITRSIGYNTSKQFIPLLLSFTPVKNTGAAFSLFANSTSLLSLLSLLVSIVLIIFFLVNSSFIYWKGLGLAFLLGGTIGNGIDRWRLGYVNDFLDLYIFNFPIFNIADIAINISIVCLIIDALNTNKRME